MNAEQFKNLINEAATAAYKEYNNGDLDSHPYALGCAYGKYEMARYILGHFEDFVKANSITPR